MTFAAFKPNNRQLGYQQTDRKLAVAEGPLPEIAFG